MSKHIDKYESIINNSGGHPVIIELVAELREKDKKLKEQASIIQAAKALLHMTGNQTWGG